MRRELLEDLYGLRRLAPSRMAELMDELSVSDSNRRSDP